MTQPNVLVQTAGQLKKLFTMILWKPQKDKAVSFTVPDMPAMVIPAAPALEYKAANRGVVLGE